MAKQRVHEIAKTLGLESKQVLAALKEAGDNWNSNTADYLIGTPLIADYLEEGLNQLGY